jgi:hypothetical protein
VIPLTDLVLTTIPEIEYHDKTYKILLNKDRVSGYITEIEAVKQAIYLILHTERYRFPIYSWDYGIELADLIGKPIPYVKAVVKKRIQEALSVDNRIKNCCDFEFETIKKNELFVTFTVNTIYGSVSSELEVTV